MIIVARRVDWSEPWHLKRIWASPRFPDAAVGTALGLFAASGSPYKAPLEYWWVGSIALMVLAAVHSGLKLPRPTVLAGYGALLGMAWLAVPVSAAIGSSEADMTLGIALWVTLMGGILCLKVTGGAFAWAMPWVGLHALSILWQAWHPATLPYSQRAHGIEGTPSSGAGLLLLGIAYVGATRNRYWALLFAVALPSTGARLAFGAFVLLLPAFAWKNGKLWTLATALAVAGTVAVLWEQPGVALRIADGFVAEGESLLDGAHYRATLPFNETASHLAGIIPLGASGDAATHTLPLRLWYEIGAIGGIAWGLMTWSSLTRRMFTPAWWVMFTLTGLSMLDYYGWMPLSISAFWWLAVKVQSESKALSEGWGQHEAR